MRGARRQSGEPGKAFMLRRVFPRLLLCSVLGLDQTGGVVYRLFVILSCRGTSVTVLHQDIGDTSGGVGGDTCEDGWRVWPMSVRVRVCLSGEENQ